MVSMSVIPGLSSRLFAPRGDDCFDNSAYDHQCGETQSHSLSPVKRPVYAPCVNQGSSRHCSKHLQKKHGRPPLAVIDP